MRESYLCRIVSGEVPTLWRGAESVGGVRAMRSSGLRRDGRGRFRRPRLAPDWSTGSSGSRGSSGTASSQSQSSLRRKGHCCFEPLCPVFFKLRFNRDHGPVPLPGRISPTYHPEPGWSRRACPTAAVHRKARPSTRGGQNAHSSPKWGLARSRLRGFWSGFVLTGVSPASCAKRPDEHATWPSEAQCTKPRVLYSL
jgi:hypothetical protein